MNVSGRREITFKGDVVTKPNKSPQMSVVVKVCTIMVVTQKYMVYSVHSTSKVNFNQKIAALMVATVNLQKKEECHAKGHKQW